MGTKTVTKVVALLAATTIIAGCGAEAATEPSDAEAATSTTRTPRITDDSGRPPVTFDPCHDIPDDVMTEAGYDAATKEIADMPMGWYTFLGCTYDGTLRIPGVLRRYGLNILSGNVSLAEEQEKKGAIARPVSVNGRAALLEVDPAVRDTCKYALETTFGIVLISRIYHKDYVGELPQHEWCAGMEDLVQAIEPFIRD